MNRLSVLLCSEGTYPFYHGGVSVWCDQLVRGLNDVDFHVFTITHSPRGKPLSELPCNVAELREFPLWGTDQPGSQQGSLPEMYKRGLRTTGFVIRNEFLDAFKDAVTCILNKHQPEKLASSLVQLHLYFKHFDYAKTMSSFEAWEVFLASLQALNQDGALTLHDAMTCMRWLHRFLGVLSIQLPQTDITHSSIAGLAGVPGLIAKLLRSVPFLVTEHGIFLRELYLSLRHSGYTEKCRRFLLAFHESIVRMNYHFADRVTALGRFNKRWQVRLGAPESKIWITPNGLDPSRFRSTTATVRTRPTVLTMARIYHLKGIEYLIAAAAVVKARVPDVLFKVLGETADETYHRGCLQLIAELGLQDTIQFGIATSIPEAYASADVFCLPSISEGMPYSIIEAMFSRCPVVATDVGNVAEMLDSTGLVVRPADPEDLASALLLLLDGGDQAASYRKLMADSAAQRADKLYTLEKAIGAFRDLYGALIDESRHPKMYTAAAG